MPTIRYATPEDAALISQHRHRMFADNQFCSEERLCEMDAAFEPWVRRHLAAGTYTGLLIVEEDAPEVVVAAAGIYWMEFPPHWMHIEPMRAYLLNFYTAPEARGRGYAKLLVERCVAEARERGLTTVTLHASRFGRPVYEKFGFQQTPEMMLRL